MRDIKFRGLVENISNGARQWAYYGVGSKPSLCGMIWIVEDEQFTGLHDKNGKEIYEGDIVREEMQNGIDYISIVVYDAPSFYFYNARNDIESYVHSSNCAVIGNVHENAELVSELVKA